MDVNTSLVQTYLRINGYFTATDYPLLESRRDSPARMLTDIDRGVNVMGPPLGLWRDHTPVLVDDITSTARTMIESVAHLLQAGYQAPVGIAVHAVFSGNAYENLLGAGADRIVTSNSVNHASNAIDINVALAETAGSLLAADAECSDH